MDSENKAYLWTILYTICKNIRFVFVKEMSPWDDSLTHKKHMFDREKTDNNQFWWVIYYYVYLPTIPTFHTSN